MTAGQHRATVARLRRRADRAQNADEYDVVLVALARANAERAATVAAERADRRAAALQSAVAHAARAAELRALGNEEHAADYDAMAARARARAAEYAS